MTEKRVITITNRGGRSAKTTTSVELGTLIVYPSGHRHQPEAYHA